MSRLTPRLTTALLASTILFAASAAAAAEPSVVVTIKPIHSLVSAITEGVVTPTLIVDGAASPHTYSLKPSQAAALESANVIFWVGPNLEAFMEKPLEALGGKAKVVELQDAPGLITLPYREGGPFEAHMHDENEGHAEGEAGHDHAKEEAHAHAGEAAHAHEGEDEHAEVKGHDHAHEHGHDHDHHGIDAHLWLDPQNASAMADEIAKTMKAADPEHAAAYDANLAKLKTRLKDLETSIAATIAPVKDKPFIVFHDAYQYFEGRFGAKVAGSITVSPEVMPGAQRLKEIHEKIGTLGATCIFAEPQFEPKLVNTVIEGTKAKAGVLDPEAGNLTAGPDLYFQMMEGIATSLKTCLSSEG
ncbi:zinc transport system substrate-binding protein [Rhizobium sp. RU20A]|uniref:zinc ABC transporter substrate-binding protein ZnuA n=1 Tax=Rhizobium sp. RU20A TaxID=1907412 RepID=UPI000956AE9E|nr:zinc ABC transporter substrate-binding protein ZnuA [Rhizobium sp. RU20A]SIQ15184.1 zinc transport system substrate-binding protein [Rhizobium sp. RU20A]